MSDGPYTVRRSREFKDRIALYMRFGGIDAKVARPEKPSVALQNEHAPSHFDGVHDWVIYAQSSVHARPAEGIADAREAAKKAGVLYSAVVLARANVEPGEEFVVMSLATFTLMLAELKDAAKQDSRRDESGSP